MRYRPRRRTPPRPPRPIPQADGADRAEGAPDGVLDFLERYLEVRVPDHQRAILQTLEDLHE